MSTSTILRRFGAFLAIAAAAAARAAGGTDAAPAAEAAPKATALDPALRRSVEAAMDKGLAWLKENQKENGAWSNENYPAMTAMGLWAAAPCDKPGLAAMRARAAEYVAGFAQPDGGIYKPATGGRGSGGLSTYNTAICMTALHALDRNKYAPLILKAREFVAGAQLQGDSPGAGGFGYERAGASPRDRADLSHTGWALMAMRRTEDMEDWRPKDATRVDVDWAAAVRFAEPLQGRDAADPANFGGFGYERGGERGGADVNPRGVVALSTFGSMTYAGLESMIYARLERDDPRVVSAIEWAARHWSVDENPGMGSKGLYYYYTIMAKALRLSGRGELRGEGGRTIPWRRDLLSRIVALQKPDGSWSNADNTFWEGDPALVTAYALLTIGHALGE